MTALIGWSGLIGLELLTKLPQDTELYNSKNLDTISGKLFKTIYFCGLPAEKWRINQNPEEDFENLQRIKAILKTVKTDKFILISTVDVLNCTEEQDESGNNYANHPYGKHRLEMETWANATFENTYILRLPGLFGKGLKKNIIYDLLYKNNLSAICLSSSFQWFNIQSLYSCIDYCIVNNIHLINIVSEPITVKKIVEIFFPELKYLCIGKTSVDYKLKTLYGCCPYWNYWKSEKEILEDMHNYIVYEKQIQSLPFRIAVSNIAWDHSILPDIKKVLNRYRINSLEIAPTKINEWSGFTDSTLDELKEYNLNFVSCQSILYSTNIKIFENPEDFVNHVKKVAEICSRLEIQNIVFGSPNQRHLSNKNEDYIIPYLKQIGDICQEKSLQFCIEPNSIHYGCTWLTNIKDTIRFVNKVNHPNIKVNFDTGNYLMEKDTYCFDDKTIQYIGNVQISNYNLSPLCDLEENNKQKTLDLLKMLYSYRGVISLEMRDTTIQKLVKSIDIFMSLLISI